MPKYHWSHGDVALVRVDFDWQLGEYCAPDDSYPSWRLFSGGRRDAGLTQARPVLIADPEDEKQMRELAYRYRSAPTNRTTSARLTNAIREMATPEPKKPEEPTKRFSCVKDREGYKWFLIYTDGGASWVREGQFSSISKWRIYADIDAVEVVEDE